MMGSRPCHYLCSSRGSGVSDLLATAAALCPVCHSHAPFMWKRSLINWRERQLPTLSCLEEQKAECLSRPDFCPADGVLVLLLSPYILKVEDLLRKAVVSFPSETTRDLPSRQNFFLQFHSLATKTNYHLINFLSETLASWRIHSENKTRAHNTVMVLERVLVSWCIIFHRLRPGIVPVSLMEPAGIGGSFIALTPFVMMAVKLSRFANSSCISFWLNHHHLTLTLTTSFYPVFRNFDGWFFCRK